MSEREKKKSFFGKLIEKLDKKMEEKSKTKPSCDVKGKSKGKQCCS